MKLNESIVKNKILETMSRGDFIRQLETGKIGGETGVNVDLRFFNGMYVLHTFIKEADIGEYLTTIDENKERLVYKWNRETNTLTDATLDERRYLFDYDIHEELVDELEERCGIQKPSLTYDEVYEIVNNHDNNVYYDGYWDKRHYEMLSESIYHSDNKYLLFSELNDDGLLGYIVSYIENGVLIEGQYDLCGEEDLIFDEDRFTGWLRPSDLHDNSCHQKALEKLRELSASA